MNAACPAPPSKSQTAAKGLRISCPYYIDFPSARKIAFIERISHKIEWKSKVENFSKPK